MAEAVYVLCALTSIVCAGLLYRGYLRNRTRMLFWSSLCFIGLAANNVLLYWDQVLAPGVTVYVAGMDIGILRSLVALAAISSLIYGLILDAE